MVAYDSGYSGKDDLLSNKNVNFEDLKEKYKRFIKFDNFVSCLINLPDPVNVPKN